jgi:hypothetical protein
VVCWYTAWECRYGPITSCLPTTLPVDEVPLARDTLTALSGQALTSVLAGSISTSDTPPRPVHLDYEVYSNTYRAFALLLPQRRVTLGMSARAGELSQLDQRHRFPGCRVVEGILGAGAVGGASAGGKLEGSPTRHATVTARVTVAFPQVNGGVAGTGFEPV